MTAETWLTCSSCYENGLRDGRDIYFCLDIDDAVCDRNGNHLTFYHPTECETCGEELSVVEYAKVHTYMEE